LGIREKLTGLFRTSSKTKKKDVELLRAEFSHQFERFQHLIAANRNALQKMAEIEEALRSNQPLGINFARSRCATALDNVAEMVRLLNEMHPGKYEELFLRFQQIEHAIFRHVQCEPRMYDPRLVVGLNELDRTFSGLAGDKMANLGELRNRLGLATPAGFVVTEDAYWRFIEHNEIQVAIDRQLVSVGPDDLGRVYAISREIQARIKGAEFPDDLAAALGEQVRALESEYGPEVPLAVRSSAQGEDLPARSCAGMYHTSLGVLPAGLPAEYKKIVASKYEARAMIYRLNYGIRDDQVAMCVGCLPLVDAASGGVAYSSNPLDANDDRVMIHSVIGLPGTVADGSARSDLLVVDRSDPPRLVRAEIAGKQKKTVYRKGTGTVEVTLDPREGAEPSLDEATAVALAEAVLEIEEHFGVPQDVEWALDRDGELVFLQCRPMTQRRASSVFADISPVVEIAAEPLLEGEITASPGAAAGEAFVVRSEADALRFPEGSVMVAAQPLPDWAVVMRRVVALVCEQGSIAGHLANVARELHVPALFGVEGALENIDTGDPITVDADRRRVYKGAVESLLKKWRRPTEPVITNTIYEALEHAAEHIVHLGLLDPDDKTKFNPQNCETLHDITRFCHEKALREMFRFGDDHQFPDRAARQLYVDGRTQFWVIDLEDGFTEAARGKRRVELDEIQSLPMQALWRGMMTIPWEQPPVDTAGFMEVLAGSAANPGLNPALPSPYSQRNYFMITRKFCSNKTRFGYHFSTVEALVGDNRRENYVSFNFRGGAAGERRRARRARLVSEILAEHDFRVHTVGDSVHARLEKYRRAFLEPRLEVIGYLMVHTRQLDMVLTDTAAVKRYHDKFRSDIARLHEITSRTR
jgi:pyruvate,water dikinase